MFEIPGAEELKRRLVDAAVAAGVGFTGEEGGFLDHLLGPVAMELWTLYSSMSAVLPIAFVDESSGEYIDLRCAEYGLERKAGTRARCAMTLTGRAGTRVPAGTAFLTAEGLAFTLLADVTLTGGEDAAQAEAEAAGDAWNVEEGVLSQMVTTIPGLEAWTNAAARGGTDRESDAALVGRLYDYLRKPATSGNVYHYEQWALETPGVGAARVTPLWAGAGTVRVLLAGPERGPVGEAVAEACAEHIEELRPVGAQVTVASAGALRVDVACTVVLDGSASVETVREALAAKLDAYLKGLSFREYTVRYNRVAFLLLDIDGVQDYTALTVNGGTGDLVVGPEQVPVLGEVRVS